MSRLKKSRPVIICMLLGLSIGWAVGMSNDVEYEFSTEVIAGFPESHAQKVREASGEASTDFDVLMHSPVLIRQAMEKWKLDQTEGLKHETDLATTIRTGISTRRLDAATFTYEVGFRHRDPQAARTVCRALVAVYSDIIGADPNEFGPESLRAILLARRDALMVLHELGSISDQRSTFGGVSPEVERRKKELVKLLAEREKAFAVVLADKAATIKEMVAREPILVVINQDKYERVRKNLRPAMIVGTVVGAVIGILVVIRRRLQARSQSPSHDDISAERKTDIERG